MKITRTFLPPFRWVGGKGRLLGTLEKYLPTTPVRRYFEPFMGGGAFFFKYGHAATECYLSDVCAPLMNAYEWLQTDYAAVEQLLQELKALDYYQIRDEFNKNRVIGRQMGRVFNSELRAAAQFIALNHMCYNGVYRENSEGRFNVPHGKKGSGPTARPVTLDTLHMDNLHQAAVRLDGVQMAACAFNDTPDHWPLPGLGDLVFYDPPYLAEYSQYIQHGFGEEEHVTLRAQVAQCAHRGATVILCNSNNELTRSIFGTPTHVVQVQRTVGNSLRGSATEAIYVFNKDA